MDKTDIENSNIKGLMNFYITKPTHDKYGRIQISETFNTLDELIDDCSIWVKQPTFEKPFICVFENTLCIRGWDSRHGYVGKLKYFPNCDVKDELKKLALNSIDESFHENINERYHRWIGVVDAVLTQSENSGNFNLYLTKPCASSIQSRGIDLAEIWLDKPVLEKQEAGTVYEYQRFIGKSSISGRYFRKEKHFLLDSFWNSIVNSFDVPDSDNFLYDINDNNSKPGQSRSEFLKEYYLNLNLLK